MLFPPPLKGLGEAGDRVRRSLLVSIPGSVWLGTHPEDEATALIDFIVSDVVADERLTVELSVLNIVILGAVILSLDDELVSVLHRNGCLAEDRRTDNILVGTGRNGIKAEGRENVPRGHAALVLIARETVGGGVVESVHNLTHPILRLPGLTGIGVKVRQVLNGLVAVGILSHTCLLHLYHLMNLAAIPTGIYLARNREDGIYLLTETLPAAKQVDKAVDIMEYGPDIMPGAALGIWASPLDG